MLEAVLLRLDEGTSLTTLSSSGLGAHPLTTYRKWGHSREWMLFHKTTIDLFTFL